MPEAPKVRTEFVKVGPVAVVLLWLGYFLVRAVWWLFRRPLLWLIRRPLVWVAVVAGSALWWGYSGCGLWPLAVGAGVVAVGLVGWRLGHAGSFRRVVAWPARAWWRRVFVYRPRWQPLMAALNLAATSTGGEVLMPRLCLVRSTGTVDRVRVRMLPGQVLADYAKNADRFAATFKAIDCRVRCVHRVGSVTRMRFWVARAAGQIVNPPAPRPSGVLELWLLINDPLQALTPLLEVPARPNLTALPLARGEDGLVWALRLLANHLLVIGATGAGKGSVLWSIIRALGHGIRTGLVELWVIDPKGGMEFAAGQALFARYCYGDDETNDGDRKRAYELSYGQFLEVAVDRLRERQRRLRGIARMHRPAPGDPLIVIVIDEIASLTAYVVDREAKKRIEAALNLLLSQGRAVGVVVVGAGQDARKEVIAMRSLFPTRIALRLNEADETDMVLGAGARDRGARCEQIPLDLPGVGYVRAQTRPEPVRVRFGYIDDNEIQTMCTLYAPEASAPGLRLVTSSGKDGSDEAEDPDEGVRA